MATGSRIDEKNNSGPNALQGLVKSQDFIKGLLNLGRKVIMKKSCQIGINLKEIFIFCKLEGNFYIW